MKILLLLIANSWALSTSNSPTVTSANLADGSVTTAKLADGSVTTSKLSAGAVTTSKIATDALVGYSGGATITGNVGIGTTNPSSTFQVLAATFSVFSTGIVSAPGNPYVLAPTGACFLKANVSTQMFYGAPAAGNDTLSMWGGASSSGTFTVPANGAGVYTLQWQQYSPGSAASSWIVDFKKNGSLAKGCYLRSTTALAGTLSCSASFKLAAADVITIFVNQGEAEITPDTNANYNWFSMKKDDI